MADEIKVHVSLNVENGYYKWSYAPGQVSIDQAAIGADSRVQEIGTSEENIDVGDVSTEGLVLMRNLDTTNFVTYGPQVGTGNMEAMGKIKPGEVALWRMLPGAQLRAKADTAAVKLFRVILED